MKDDGLLALMFKMVDDHCYGGNGYSSVTVMTD